MSTTEEKQAYADEVQAAQEEAAAATFEPPSADISESEWALMNTRRGQGDAELLFDIIVEHGAINIVADPEAPAEGGTPEEPVAEQQRLEAMTRAELDAEAASRGLSVPSSASKAEVVQAILDDEA